MERRRACALCGNGTLEHLGAGRRSGMQRRKGKARSGGREQFEPSINPTGAEQVHGRSAAGEAPEWVLAQGGTSKASTPKARSRLPRRTKRRGAGAGLTGQRSYASLRRPGRWCGVSTKWVPAETRNEVEPVLRSGMELTAARAGRGEHR